jgi:NAD(P)-dependent dehydrogenase (short-subunit alcohol dehydrogenase family)
MEGKIAIVSGSAQGLGANIAELFAGAGAAVLVTDILDEVGEQAAARCRDEGHLPAPRRDQSRGLGRSRRALQGRVRRSRRLGEQRLRVVTADDPRA